MLTVCVCGEFIHVDFISKGLSAAEDIRLSNRKHEPYCQPVSHMIITLGLKKQKALQLWSLDGQQRASL